LIIYVVFLDGNKYHFINTIVPRNEGIVRNIIPQLRQRHVRQSFFRSQLTSQEIFVTCENPCCSFVKWRVIVK